MKKILFLLPFLLFSICCTNSPKTIDNKPTIDFTKDSLSILWRADSTGFGKGKSRTNLDMLFKRYNMQDLSCKEIIEILGQPIKKINNYIDCREFRYYLDGHYWDENGDGRIDSTSEFEKHAVYFEFKNGKWVISYTT